MVKITFSTGVGTWNELLRSQGVGHIYASREVARRHDGLTDKRR
jgi:hypothetical protein